MLSETIISGMGLKLVIVDDAPFIREAIRNALNKSDIQLIGEATNGNEAVQMVLKLNPDIVLMDMVMPEKNGIDATKEILDQNPSIKIVACSTIDEKNIMMRALQAGCCEFITKPFEKETLIKTLHKAGGE